MPSSGQQALFCGQSLSDRHGRESSKAQAATNLNIQDLDKDIPYPGGVPWPQQPADAYLLVPNREFHNVIYVHWVLYWNVHNKLPKIEDALDHIIELTTSELAR